MTYLDDAWHKQSEALLRRAAILVTAAWTFIGDSEDRIGDATWHQAANRWMSDYERRDEWTVGDNQNSGSSPGEVRMAPEAGALQPERVPPPERLPD